MQQSSQSLELLRGAASRPALPPPLPPGGARAYTHAHTAAAFACPSPRPRPGPCRVVPSVAATGAAPAVPLRPLRFHGRTHVLRSAAELDAAVAAIRAEDCKARARSRIYAAQPCCRDNDDADGDRQRTTLAYLRSAACGAGGRCWGWT